MHQPSQLSWIAVALALLVLGVDPWQRGSPERGGLRAGLSPALHRLARALRHSGDQEPSQGRVLGRRHPDRGATADGPRRHRPHLCARPTASGSSGSEWEQPARGVEMAGEHCRGHLIRVSVFEAWHVHLARDRLGVTRILRRQPGSVRLLRAFIPGIRCAQDPQHHPSERGPCRG